MQECENARMFECKFFIEALKHS